MTNKKQAVLRQVAVLTTLLGGTSVTGAQLLGQQPPDDKRCVEKTEQGERPYTCGESLRGKMLEHSHATPLPRPSSSEREGKEFDELPYSSLTREEVRMVLEAHAPKVEPPTATVILQDTLSGTNFESGRAELLPEGISTLEVIVAKMAGKTNIRFEVVGHTDNQRISARLRPVYPDNQALSVARALTVAGYLKKQLGLSIRSFSASGMGEAQPIADNNTPEGMAKNRRTVIRIWYKEPQVVQPKIPPQPVAKRVLVDPCAVPQNVPSGLPFSISVDGMPMGTDTHQVEADRQRCVDVAFDKADIQVKYDPLVVAPSLNTWVAGGLAVRGQAVQFRTYSNYNAWVKKAEIRVFPKGRTPQENPVAILPVGIGGIVQWQPGVGIPTDVYYLLRVYDVRGRFDETAGKPLQLLDRLPPEASDKDKAEREALTGWGENSLTLRNIHPSGGTVTVSGRYVQPGHVVTALGETVPVDKEGRFVVRQILPPGPHTVEVGLKDSQGRGTTFHRNLNIPDKDWFYVAMADITIGRDHTTGPAPLVTADTQHYSNSTWIDGRGAFYLKGKIKGEYLLTASADTGEQPINQLFTNFSSKDPYYLLRNIDPNRYYPVYGDDSVITDDAPTQGRFYVKLERRDSHVMWGNFKTTWTGTELTNYNRGLYGGNAVWNSEQSTPYGEKRSTVNVFVADPGTLQSREEFRGTGGSLYWLRHQNLTQGSERLWLEVRDKDSGLVLERKALTVAQDYEIDYLQGRIVLRAPLSSVVDSSGLVQGSSLAGNPLYLLSSYEYAPGLSAISGSAVGLRASHWFTDHIRLGMTGYHQGDSTYWQDLRGLDATLRYKPGTYIRMEVARSSGPGSESYASINGGYNFATVTSDGRTAQAKRIEATVNLADVTPGAKGRVSMYFQSQQAGFSAPGQTFSSTENTLQKGASAVAPIGQNTEIAVKGDARVATSQSTNAVELAVRNKVNAEWGVSVGVRQDNRTTNTANASATLSESGRRNDVIVRVDYTPLEDGQPKDQPLVTQANVDNSVGRYATLPASKVDPNNAASTAAAVTDGNTVVTRAAPSGANMGTPGNGPASGLLPATTSTMSSAGLGQMFDPSVNAGVAASRSLGLKYKPWSAYGYVQDTWRRDAGRSSNDRLGMGLMWQASERLRLGAEMSGGNGGTGGRLAGDYRVDDRSNYYMAYAMENEAADTNYRGRRGSLTTGSRYRLSEQVGLFGETRWANGAGSQSLTNAFGVDLAPNDRWTYGSKFEKGRVSDALAGDLDRVGLALSTAYKFEKVKFSSTLEYRRDETNVAAAASGATYSPGLSVGYNSRTVWLMRNSLNYQASKEWRMLGRLNFSRTSNSQGAFYDGDYTEVVMGAAYRPINNDRWNTLFKYTYFENVPSPGQVDSAYSSTATSSLDYSQRSQVINIDTIYDMRPWVSVGFKYGYRWGALRNSKVSGEWFSSRAELMALRFDFHFVKEWDALIELRHLRAQEAGDARSGLLLAIYRHFGEHLKVGFGYNFTDFSDNLTDLSYRSHGWFINGISTY